MREFLPVVDMSVSHFRSNSFLTSSVPNMDMEPPTSYIYSPLN